MKTLTINTYDPAGRFNMTDKQAKQFFDFVEQKAIEAGYDVKYGSAIYVDEDSENFINDLFNKYHDLIVVKNVLINICDINKEDQVRVTDAEINTLLGNIQVNVSFNYNDVGYVFSFQTTTTFDYGAVNSELAVYKYTEEYDNFVQAIANDKNLELSEAEEFVEEFFKDFIVNHNIQSMFDSYVNENYIVHDYHGFDAKSLSNNLSIK